MMSFCVHKLGLAPDLPCWVSQELVSQKLFGDSGVRSLKITEAYHQSFFLWGTQFSNVHTTFNFDEPPIIINGVTYPGPEQYFQVMKSFNTPDHTKALEKMFKATPDQAFSLGRSYQLREDWEQVKEKVMEDCLFAKFTQHADLKGLLLATGTHMLVQLKPNDVYWGTGPDGKGLNRHAVILMMVRAKIAEEVALLSTL